MSSTTKDATAVHSGEGSREENMSSPSSSSLRHKIRLKPVLDIPDQDEGILLGGSETKVFLKRGTLHDRPYTYVAKCHRSVITAGIEAFFYIQEDLLRPLQGICIPHFFGISQVAEGGLSCIMATPHCIGWRRAHKALPKEIRDRIIRAYERLHRQGVLHGRIAFHHILLGDDDRVTIVDFSAARSMKDYKHAGIKRCEETDLRRELREVKHLLGYEETPERQNRLDNELAASDALEFEQLDALDLSESDADTKIDSRSTHFEIPVDKRNDPAEAYPRVQMSSASVHLSAEAIQSSSGTEKVQEKANISHTSPSTVEAKSDARTELRIRPVEPIRSRTETKVSIPIREARSCTATHGSPSPPPRRASAPASPPPTPPDVVALSVPPPSYKWVDRSTYDGDAPCTRDLLPDNWIPLPKKRSFDVAFHPDTVDNSFWADGREPKRHVRRSPTPFIASEQAPQDDADANSDTESESETESQPQLLQAKPWEQDVNPREPPPYRDASGSPTTQDTTNPQPPVEDADEVRIVITSPTGQRRVWGVPETMATQISMLLDQRADRLLAQRMPQQTIGSSSTTKRTADQISSQEEESSKPKLPKRTHSLFSRFFE